MSSQKSYEIFHQVEKRVGVLESFWDNFKAEVIRHLPESYVSEIEELSQNLELALEKLLYELRHPTLILATTGTTSSGKSTLVNFLCGADIVPTAVEEMSAGMVTVEYREEKALIVRKTPGALWDCREWSDISEHEIYDILEQVMRTYIDNKIEQPNLGYPEFVIHYPFRLFKECKDDLPRGVKVRIIDLPGLSYVGDDSNMEVIKQCREALCLVTYNSEENNPRRIKTLLSQVVEEVKSLGGSPERMLFILNKIDAFRANKNWEESEKRFIEKTIKSIKNQLTEELAEYAQYIEQLQVTKLSTRPAFLSLGVRSSNKEQSIKSCRDARNLCAPIIEDILDELVGAVNKWSDRDRERVAESLWCKSYAEEFQQYLNGHITQHFPKLVIPQAIDRFKGTVGDDIAQWAVQTTTAILNSSEENYQKESEKISQVKVSLNNFLRISDANLRKPFEDINRQCESYLGQSSSEDLVRILEGAVKELQMTEPYDQIEEKLIPLYAWREALGRGVDQVLEEVARSLEEGAVVLESPNFQRVDATSSTLLESNLNRLIRLGYSYSVARDGKNIEARTQEEKNNLKELNTALNELSMHLSLVIAEVLTRVSKQEINRMYDAVEELFKYHLDYLGKSANEIAPDIVIGFPTSQLSKVEEDLEINLSFDSDFDIEEKTWNEDVWKVQENVLTSAYDSLPDEFRFFGFKVRKPAVDKVLRDVGYKTIEIRSSDNAKVPSTEEILTDWKDQLRQVEPDMLKQVIEWLLGQIDLLKKKVDTTQNEILDLYLERLERARQEIDLDFERLKETWEPMKKKAKKLASDISDLGNLKK